MRDVVGERVEELARNVDRAEEELDGLLEELHATAVSFSAMTDALHAAVLPN